MRQLETAKHFLNLLHCLLIHPTLIFCVSNTKYPLIAHVFSLFSFIFHLWVGEEGAVKEYTYCILFRKFQIKATTNHCIIYNSPTPPHLTLPHSIPLNSTPLHSIPPHSTQKRRTSNQSLRYASDTNSNIPS